MIFNYDKSLETFPQPIRIYSKLLQALHSNGIATEIEVQENNFVPCLSGNIERP